MLLLLVVMFSLVSDWLRRLGVLQRLAVKITICIILHYGIIILLHSVNLILLTVLLVHLILHISPSYPLKPIYHSIYHSHHLSLTHSLTPDWKPIRSTNPFLQSVGSLRTVHHATGRGSDLLFVGFCVLVSKKYGPAKLRDSIRFRIVREIRNSIRIDGPIRNFRYPLCQSSFVKKRLVVVKFAFKVDFGSKISVQQHCLTHFMTELK